REACWESMEVGELVEGRITGMNKGGLEINLNGIRGFMPASQVDVAHIRDISVFIGQKVPCQIIELNRRAGSVLVSRRKYLEKEQQKQRAELLDGLAEGQIRKGVVGNLTDFGAFVDLGGVDGLIHISDLSYGQVEKVSDVVQPGQEVEVKILKVNREREKVSLGLKHVAPDPWGTVTEKYTLDANVTVRVLRLEKFGAFVELEEGVEGLIPLSEMSWSRIVKASQVLQVGQLVEAVIIRLEPDRRRIALSIKQVEPDPWDGVSERFPKESVHTGTVTKCMDFGAFIQLAPGVEGLAHISELSDKRIGKCEEVVQPRQEVEVRVLSVDADQRRISLSLKPADAAPSQKAAAPPPPKKEQARKKKRKRPLRGGLTSHFEWQGRSLGS
ncbi:MAG TPA: S1 RNA-binding domain-containing protein, partial [Phycisphaerae bacterium]|nr:S1 RNA-binding domain-containing protein [Phycisphaerae bacterium]